jgi:hypothetical protein
MRDTEAVVAEPIASVIVDLEQDGFACHRHVGFEHEGRPIGEASSGGPGTVPADVTRAEVDR